MEVGLGFTADFDKEGGFIGKEAVLAQKDEMKARGGLKQRLLQVMCKDPEEMMYHAEVLWRNGERVGDVRAASYGHTLGGSVGLAMVTAPGDGVVNKKFIDEGVWEVEVSNRRVPIKVSLSPLYDPKNLKIKS